MAPFWRRQRPSSAGAMPMAWTTSALRTAASAWSRAWTAAAFDMRSARAVATSVITDSDRIPPDRLEALQPIIGKYVGA